MGCTRQNKENSYSNFGNDKKCSMLEYFLKGKTHDIYGAIILAIVSIFMIITSDNVEVKALELLSLIIGVGIAVDLWAHCFHH